MRARDRRLASLEARMPPVITPEIRALAERMAAEEGDRFTADELLAGVVETWRAIGPPYTTERMARHAAAATGGTVDELMADAARLSERHR